MRPRLAPGFTVVIDAGSVWLVAGEDVRYRLRTDEPAKLRDVLAMCDGSRTLDQLAERDTLEQLIAERVLVEGTAAQADAGEASIELFWQDSLDYRALVAKNRASLAKRWMWITTGPGARAYVSPVFVPGAGPCAECLLVHFKRLSPAPELYDALIAHDGPIAPSTMPAHALETIRAFVRWKTSLPAQVAALYALHVVELSDLAITSHVPLVDPECSACR